MRYETALSGFSSDKKLMSKVITFKSKKEINYPDALSELIKNIGSTNQSWSSDLVAVVYNAAKALETGVKLDDATAKNLAGFLQWIRKYHTGELEKIGDQRFPNNIFMDMLMMLRNSDQSADKLVLLVFEGANAHFISGGRQTHKKPDVDFLASALLVGSARAVEALAEVSEEKFAVSKDTQAFLNEFGGESYTQLHARLKNLCSSISGNIIHKTLSDNKVYWFEKDKNVDHGANQYGLEEAIEKAKKLLQSIDSEQLKTATKNLAEKCQPLVDWLNECPKLDENSELKEQAFSWDESEWLAKIYVALKSVANGDVDDPNAAQVLLNQLNENSFFSETIRRGIAGEFPGKVRNDMIVKAPMAELFLEHDLILQPNPASVSQAGIFAAAFPEELAAETGSKLMPGSSQ